MPRLVILTSLFLFGFSSLVLPHSGGLNKDGCHNNRKTGEYHCHRGQAPSKSKIKQQIISPVMPLLSSGGVTLLPPGTKAYDGDDLRFKDKRPNVRLVGCDTPEIGSKAECEFEAGLAKKAKTRLQQLINTNTLELEYVACSCTPGTQGTKACNSGRDCGIVRYNGKNVCDILISEGLAHVYKCWPTMCPKQENWCEK